MARMIRFFVVAATLAGTVSVSAQEQPASVPAGKPALVPLKLELVLTRTQGEKKVSSLPYVLWITANEPTKTSLRIGVEVPVPSGDKSFHYRPVGTNIDCSAVTAADDFYRISLTLNESSVHLRGRGPKDSDPTTVAGPSFQSFTANFTILLRDGQTAQYTSATDSVSGEVLRVDATLNVIK